MKMGFLVCVGQMRQNEVLWEKKQLTTVENWHLFSNLKKKKINSRYNIFPIDGASCFR